MTHIVKSHLGNIEHFAKLGHFVENRRDVCMLGPSLSSNLLPSITVLIEKETKLEALL